MPVHAVIASTVNDYRFNNDFLVNSVKDLSHEEWFKQPNDCTNHIAWLVGHVIWTRSRLLGRLGVEWSAPWLDHFARGSKLDGGAGTPSPDELLNAWREISGVLINTLETVSEETLAEPAPQPGPPSADGKVSGFLQFLAWHETYHLGQASYVRCWLGHKGLMG